MQENGRCKVGGTKNPCDCSQDFEVNVRLEVETRVKNEASRTAIVQTGSAESDLYICSWSILPDFRPDKSGATASRSFPIFSTQNSWLVPPTCRQPDSFAGKIKLRPEIEKFSRKTESFAGELVVRLAKEKFNVETNTSTRSGKHLSENRKASLQRKSSIPKRKVRPGNQNFSPLTETSAGTSTVQSARHNLDRKMESSRANL